jgi:hypothetical protein
MRIDMNVAFTILGILVIIGLAWAVWIMLRERLRPRRAPTAADAIPDASITDFEGLARHFGLAVHPDLIGLYERRDVVKRQNVFFHGDDSDVAYEIDHFLPATPDSVRQTWFQIDPDLFPVAVDGAGNYFAVDMKTPADRLLALWYVDHDGGAKWEVAHSLRAVVERLSKGNATK